MSDRESDREAQRLDFLKSAGLAEAARAPLPGDASTRRYERLTTPSGARLMLMDQPPATESEPCDPAWTPEQRKASGWNAVARLSAGRIEAFAAVAGHLRALGLSAPEIVALDTASGLAVLEDFGDDLFVHAIATGQAEEPLYRSAIEALAVLHDAPAPDRLTAPGGDWPLLIYDATALQGGADLFVDWLPKLDGSSMFDAAAIAEWQAAWEPIVSAGEAGASVMAHRDYHAENLIHLAGHRGAASVGMIDFQDALRAHPSWDLHTLLQDARRDVSPELERLALEHYFALRPTVERAPFMQAYAGLAALNNVRILGVFSRLVARDGKSRYRRFMPRMWGYLRTNLTKPGMEPIHAWFDRHVPEAARR